MSMKDTAAIDSIIDEFAESTNRLGLGLMPGKVWGTLYFYGNMTQDDLKEHLGVGLSRISPALRLLLNFGVFELLVNKVEKIFMKQKLLCKEKKELSLKIC